MQKVGICHTNLDLFSPLEISACKLCTLKNSHCGTARCYHNTQYRDSELAFSFVILDIFFSTPFSFLIRTPSGCWPLSLHVSHLLPNKQDDFLLQLCAGQLKKKDLGRVFMKRQMCLTFGQQNGNPHLLYFSRRQL